MRRPTITILACVVLLFACSESKKNKPLSEPGEKLYTLEGKIVSRDTAGNTLRVDHKAIPGFMEAMTMDYAVRGAEAGSLPPDGTTITARLHVTDKAYWLTDVKKAP